MEGFEVFAACERCFPNSSCAMMYLLLAPANPGYYRSAIPQGPYRFSHKVTLMFPKSINKYTCYNFLDFVTW